MIGPPNHQESVQSVQIVSPSWPERPGSDEVSTIASARTSGSIHSIRTSTPVSKVFAMENPFVAALALPEKNY